ncbi:MAG: DUF5606 domain-containing protein [Niabella sp.]
MEYHKLVAVSGLAGLFELVSSKNEGAIVRSLSDKTTKFASSRIHQFSHLESIEIYTVHENVNLVEVFRAMEATGEALPDAKDDKAVKSYFQKVFPDMDFERVYNSDMKKMVKWFSLLKEKNVEIKLSQELAEESEAAQDAKPEEPVKEEAAPVAEAPKAGEAAPKKAPAKKAAAKKKAPAKKKKDEA